MRKHFTEAATERCSSNLRLAALLKSFKNVCEGASFSKKLNPFEVYFKGFNLKCKTVVLRSSFSLNYPSMTIGNF